MIREGWLLAILALRAAQEMPAVAWAADLEQSKRHETALGLAGDWTYNRLQAPLTSPSAG